MAQWGSVPFPSIRARERTGWNDRVSHFQPVCPGTFPSPAKSTLNLSSEGER